MYFGREIAVCGRRNIVKSFSEDFKGKKPTEIAVGTKVYELMEDLQENVQNVFTKGGIA